MTPTALTIAGSDSGGGAGIQADLKTFSALGVYGTSVITAITAQNTLAVQAIHPLPAKVVVDQLNSILDDIRVDAIKIGMLANTEIIEALAGILRERVRVPLVLDPVMIATSGCRLLDTKAVASLRTKLLPLAGVITPNLDEAGILLNRALPTDEDEMKSACEDLVLLGPSNVLLNGGHLNSNECVDLFSDGGKLVRLSEPRNKTRNTHGTGCTLAAAVAAYLAHGIPIAKAVTNAKSYVTHAIAAADSLKIGVGQGPIHHFHALWPTGTATPDPSSKIA